MHHKNLLKVFCDLHLEVHSKGRHTESLSWNGDIRPTP